MDAIHLILLLRSKSREVGLPDTADRAYFQFSGKRCRLLYGSRVKVLVE